ncbi:MAG TPA: hypothetical protein VNB22_14550, partial [Pyrinomonadaceae bacterium]|nr:hypothetical protein [Pyrinomonadaceae bacterium]
MNKVFRAGLILSLVFSVVFFASCDAATAKKSTNSNPKKPLATPQIKSDKPKIVAFGDSLTAGFGLLEKESYP